MNFNIQLAVMFVFFVFDIKSSLKVVHPLKIYQYTKFHVPTLTGSLNVRHFGMVEGTGLKSKASRSTSMA
jgi:hypothetical protein